MRNVLIGSGFHEEPNCVGEKSRFARLWFENTRNTARKVVIVDNSESSAITFPDWVRVVRIDNNLGHINDGKSARSKLAGWSLSWILTAWIAYSEDMDFVYKEQDCLTFGDWIPPLRCGRWTFGKHHEMPCEQSLFYIERDYIPRAIELYCSIEGNDREVIPEQKFKDCMARGGFDIGYHNLGVGRDRPIPTDGDMVRLPWYAQKLKDDELRRIKAVGLISGLP